MSNRSAIGKVLRLLHISAALRLVFVLFALGQGLIPAAADSVAGQGSPAISPQDMERIVKASRDAVLQELRSQHQPASTAETAPGQDLEGEFSEQVASHGGVLYQRFSDALKAFPDLVGTVMRVFKRLDQSVVGRWSGSVFLISIIAVLCAASVAWWLTRFALRHWLGARIQITHPMPLDGIGTLAFIDIAGWFAFWVICYLASTAWFSGTGIQSMVGAWTLWAPTRLLLYLTVFEIWFRPGQKLARLVPLHDEDARRAKEFFTVIAAVIVGRSWIEILDMDLAPGRVLAAGLLLNNFVFVVSFFWAAVRSRAAIANWIGGDQLENRASSFRAFIADHWTVIVGAMVLLLAIGHAEGAVLGQAAVSRGLTMTLRIALLLIFASSLTGFITNRLAAERGSVSQPRAIPNISITAGSMIRTVIVMVALYWLAWLWLVDSLGVITSQDWWNASTHLVTPAFGIIAGYGAWSGVKFITGRRLGLHTALVQDSSGRAVAPASSRMTTLIPLLRLAAAIGITLIVTLVVLSGLGVNITPLLAGASVVGLAISFGSQTLVKDIVSGIFFMADDAFRVGEYISCGKVKGTVEGFTLRSVRLRHQSGQLHTVPFGQLGEITNFSRDWTTVKFTINLDREVDLDRIRDITKKVSAKLNEDEEVASQLLEPLKYQGISDITDNAVIIAFKFTARPINPSEVEREAKRHLLYAFREAGIALARSSFMPSQVNGLS